MAPAAVRLRSDPSHEPCPKLRPLSFGSHATGRFLPFRHSTDGWFLIVSFGQFLEGVRHGNAAEIYAPAEPLPH